jgi:glyoxylase-like metal-dependent hydrolase (beta-lactamase superfamily II)
MNDRLDDLATRVRAPNPSPMTLDGTNTYLLGAPGAGELVVVDPGPDLDGHRQEIEAAAARLDARIAAVVVTHHHRDHAEAVGWADRWGAPLYAFSPDLVHADATRVTDAFTLARGGVHLEAVHTPGHSSDHLCLRVVETDVVLTGDHVLGRGTTVVAWPDGDMGAYMASLRRLGELGARLLYPGHGPVITEPARVVVEYVAHREEREAQVLAALAAGDRTPAEIVARVYADEDPVLHPMAERSVRAHLDKLEHEHRVSKDEEAFVVRD